ncbi:hypothetical protein FHL15_004476 [Xylaria flabelliformis]|uniref:Tetraspanin Tsp3 n=1 Tax=Xylaria flabelliformis TaxID=2512241 RepID=A0A553I3C4_9PEZI|nr:hypothetical protein FHL15_004476 [Xylaria flabelliformis]
MSKLVFAFPLLVIALIGIAIYVQVTSSTLSLPISTATTVLTILLPLFAAANVVYTPFLSRLAGSPTLQQLLLPALHIIQGGLTVIIATLAAQGFAPSQTLNCALERKWQSLWHSHDGRAIERIQNAFDCCGYRSVRDRDWPDPQCEDIYHRHTSCNVPWGAAMQRTSGLEFTVAVIAGIIQHVEGAASGRLIEEPYHDDDDDDDDDANQDASQSDVSAARDNVPRVEPSGLGRDEINEWRS